MKWGKWLENSGERVIEHTYIGKVFISTVFLGIDHNFGSGPPVLFETMIFGGKHDGYQTRYRNLKDAKDGHLLAVDFVKAYLTWWDLFCHWFWEGL